MDSENNYDIVPANNSCSQVINTVSVTTTPGSAADNSSQNVNDFNNQHQASAQYDSNDIEVKPMYGGNLKFSIKFLNKLYLVNSNNEVNAIKEITYNKIFKKDNLLKIKNESMNNYNLYVVRKKDKKNSLCKLKKLS